MKSGIAFPLAVLALVVGHFAPWAQPAAAALTLSAHELSVFTNYTPNAGVFFNEGYLLPLWAAALMLAAVARRRVFPMAAAALLLVLALPGYPELRRLLGGQGSEFTMQLALTAIVAAACTLLAVRTHVSPLVRRGAAGVGAAAAAVSMIGFLVVRDAALAPLYGVPVGLGLGWWATLMAAIVCLVVVMFARIRRDSGIASGSQTT